MRRGFILLAVCAIGAVTAAGVARAEHGVIPPSTSLPWSDPAHASPLEVFASGVASQSTQRPIRVQCHGVGEWSALGFSSSSVGVVRYLYSVYTGRIVAVEDIIHLHEAVCLPLQRFAEAQAKPTRCPSFQTVTRTVWETTQVRKKVWYWKRIRLKSGKSKRVRKSRYVWVQKRVPRTVTEQVPGPSVPCYGNTATLPADYDNYAYAVHTLAHEIVHTLDFQVGYPALPSSVAESRAECYGMQLAVTVAGLFGADQDDARALAKWIWDVVYPTRQGGPYWTAECQPDSPYDITPGDGIWPSRGTPASPSGLVWRVVES
jgi:hypothetical protein